MGGRKGESQDGKSLFFLHIEFKKKESEVGGMVDRNVSEREGRASGNRVRGGIVLLTPLTFAGPDYNDKASKSSSELASLVGSGQEWGGNLDAAGGKLACRFMQQQCSSCKSNKVSCKT